MTTLPKKLTPFILHFLKKYRGWFVIALAFELVWAVENTTNPYILKTIIDRMNDFDGDLQDIWKILLFPVVLYGFFWTIRLISVRMADLCALRIYPKMKLDITVAMFSYLKEHSHQYFQNHFAGSLQNKISDMAEGVDAIMRKLMEAFAQVMMVILAVAMMGKVVHPVFSIILVTWLVTFLGIAYLFSKSIQKRSKDFSESRSRHVGKIVDSIGNVLNTRLFSRRIHEVGLVRQSVGETCEKDISMRSYILKMRVLWDITFVALMVGMLVLLINFYRDGKVTIGELVFIMTLTRSVVFPIWWLATQMIEFSGDVGKCQQALSILTVEHDVTDAPEAPALDVQNGSISFRDVGFNYHKSAAVFNEVTVEIPAGQKVGLVGFSGAGKSTFVNLLLRFYDIDSGEIQIDGQNIATVTQDSLREHLSMIPQDTSLFHRSLMENIRYGDIDATDEEVIAAAKQAYCYDFIQELPEKFDSLVGERGIKLSGGQRQRIAIARAILKNAPILILDEATSALDSVTEKYIQKGLDNLMDGRTAIVIAHRLSTLSQMDRILVFDKGSVIEDGTHENLLAAEGHYAKLWNMQAGGFLSTDAES